MLQNSHESGVINGKTYYWSVRLLFDLQLFFALG